MRNYGGKALLGCLLGALGLGGCAAPRTVHQLMDERGFGSAPMAALIQMGGASRELGPELPAVLEAMKGANLVTAIRVTPACTLSFNTGSSSARQNMLVQIAASGDGYVEYLGRRSFFNGPALRGFCIREFARSKPLGWSLRALPGQGADQYYMPVPGQ